MILKCLGKQEDDSDLSFVTSDYAMNYVKELQGTIDQDVSPHFTSCLLALQNNMKNSSYVDLVSSLLNFNPYFRMTAWDCLKHPVFDSVRDKSKESLLKRMNENCHILLPVDMDDAFDYVNSKNAKFGRTQLI